MNKCADACTSTSIDQPCGGTVLRCLTEKLDEITDAECKKEVFYFIKMEVWRLPLAAHAIVAPLCCIHVPSAPVLHLSRCCGWLTVHKAYACGKNGWRHILSRQWHVL